MGEPKPGRDRVLEPLDPILPAEKPRYLMGVGTPEDIAAAAVYLSSNEAAYVTGQTIHVNGGMAMI